MKDDFGYFGTGDEGYAQYMTAFERNFGSLVVEAGSVWYPIPEGRFPKLKIPH